MHQDGSPLSPHQPTIHPNRQRPRQPHRQPQQHANSVSTMAQRHRQQTRPHSHTSLSQPTHPRPICPSRPLIQQPNKPRHQSRHRNAYYHPRPMCLTLHQCPISIQQPRRHHRRPYIPLRPALQLPTRSQPATRPPSRSTNTNTNTTNTNTRHGQLAIGPLSHPVPVQVHRVCHRRIPLFCMAFCGDQKRSPHHGFRGQASKRFLRDLLPPGVRLEPDPPGARDGSMGDLTWLESRGGKVLEEGIGCVE